VLKDKMHKGIIVWVERTMRHPLYEKVVRSGKKYYVHDENNVAHTGDVVEISETKPISKLKRWRLLRVVRSAPKMDEAVQIGGEEEQLG
jgi:small subunit ribosomal protein S17